VATRAAGEAADEDDVSGYRSPPLLHRRITVRVGRSLIEKPKGSNSTKTLLSPVSERTEIRFFTRDGETIMLLRRRGERSVARVMTARCVTGIVAPLPIVMEVGRDKGMGWGKLPALEDMWELAPVSRNHSDACGLEGGTPEFVRAARRAWWFHTSG